MRFRGIGRETDLHTILTNSEVIKMVRDDDRDGRRTLAVITKLDLMDVGACEMNRTG